MTNSRIKDEQILQAYTSAMGTLAVALCRQLDAGQILADLRAQADLADRAGHRPAAGLIDELVRAVEINVLKKHGNH